MMKKIFAALLCVLVFALCAVPALADTDARLQDSNWLSYTAYYTNCKGFADVVMKEVYGVKLPSLENSSSQKNVRLASGPIVDSFYNVNGTLTLEKVRTALNSAKVGDVIQMYWDTGGGYGKLQHTMIVSTTYEGEDKIEFLTANWKGTIANYPEATREHFYETFRKTIVDAGIDGGFTIYRFIGDTTPTPLQEGDVRIDEANFPDENFRNYVLRNYDTNNDGILSSAEASLITEFVHGFLGITNLKGIEHFTALKRLDFWALDCTSIDLSKNTALTDLIGQSNKLTTLDVSKNTALKNLECSFGQLKNLKLGKNLELEHLYCHYNKLTELDVSECSALIELNCSENQISTLDVSKNPNLTDLMCVENKLTTIKLGNNPNLTWVGCSSNQLSEIDISGCPNIKEVACDAGVKIIRDSSSSTDTTAEKPKITTRLTATYVAQGKHLTIPIEATGTQPQTWTVTGLPPGMEADGENHALTGSPSAIGIYKVKISVENEAGKTSKSFRIFVVPAVKIIEDAVKDIILNTIVKKAYKLKLTAEGGKKVTWSAVGLPLGMKIGKSTGKISGRPKETGIFEVFVTAASKKIAAWLPGSSETIKLTLQINDKSGNVAARPEIIDVENVSGRYKVAAVLPVISVDVSGQHEIPATISDDVSEGAKLFWLANSSEPSDDDDIAEFFDGETGEEIFEVPVGRKIIVSPWLNEGVIYEPYIMVLE